MSYLKCTKFFLAFCLFLSISEAQARVCLITDPSCGKAGGAPLEFEQPDAAKKCPEDGYGYTASNCTDPMIQVDTCPLSIYYSKECCDPDYADPCPENQIAGTKMCGSRKQCVCPKTAPADPQADPNAPVFPYLENTNTDCPPDHVIDESSASCTDWEGTHFAKCTCDPAKFTIDSCTTGDREGGAWQAPTDPAMECGGKYSSCECAPESELTECPQPQVGIGRACPRGSKNLYKSCKCPDDWTAEACSADPDAESCTKNSTTVCKPTNDPAVDPCVESGHVYSGSGNNQCNGMFGMVKDTETPTNSLCPGKYRCIRNDCQSWAIKEFKALAPEYLAGIYFCEVKVDCKEGEAGCPWKLDSEGRQYLDNTQNRKCEKVCRGEDRTDCSDDKFETLSKYNYGAAAVFGIEEPGYSYFGHIGGQDRNNASCLEYKKDEYYTRLTAENSYHIPVTITATDSTDKYVSSDHAMNVEGIEVKFNRTIKTVGKDDSKTDELVEACKKEKDDCDLGSEADWKSCFGDLAKTFPYCRKGANTNECCGENVKGYFGSRTKAEIEAAGLAHRPEAENDDAETKAAGIFINDSKVYSRGSGIPVCYGNCMFDFETFSNSTGMSCSTPDYTGYGYTAWYKDPDCYAIIHNDPATFMTFNHRWGGFLSTKEDPSDNEDYVIGEFHMGAEFNNVVIQNASPGIKFIGKSNVYFVNLTLDNAGILIAPTGWKKNAATESIVQVDNFQFNKSTDYVELNPAKGIPVFRPIRFHANPLPFGTPANDAKLTITLKKSTTSNRLPLIKNTNNKCMKGNTKADQVVTVKGWGTGLEYLEYDRGYGWFPCKNPTNPKSPCYDFNYVTYTPTPSNNFWTCQDEYANPQL